MNITISNYNCDIVATNGSLKIAYLIYPQIMAFNAIYLQHIASQYGINICVIYVPSASWNNVLTPWPEPGEAKGFPPFAGDAQQFLNIIQGAVIPEVENKLGVFGIADRNLIGVSLSGLFTLWQWLQHDTFKSIACLSGSFWYTGFMDWFNKQPIPAKAGKAFFLLGKEEPKAKITAYRPVGVNTENIVARLRKDGVDVSFQWVPGNHFSDPLQRLELAFGALYAK